MLLSGIVFTAIIGGGRPNGPATMLALSVGALLWTGRLLFLSAHALTHRGALALQDETHAASGRRRRELEREYHFIKRALKELELDHAMDKVSETDYVEVRTRYRERAVRILRQLDEGTSTGYRALIDADLKARRQAHAAKPAMAAPVEATPQPPAGGTCPSCTLKNDADARFCKQCGTQLPARA